MFEGGKRLSNVDLFTKKLGYRLIDVPGDRLYEWHNPNRWHYVYKTTASDSDKYYFGRKCISKNEPTEKDCLADGYFGSGGKKFQHWAKKHKDSLQKDILFISNKCSAAKGALKRVNLHSVKDCPEHGLVAHVKDSCSVCAAEKTLKEQRCVIHGNATHRSGRCVACSNTAFINFRDCPTHGEQPHVDDMCFVCSRDAGVSAGLNELLDSSGVAHCLSCGYGFKPKSHSVLLQSSLRGVNPCPVCCWWNATDRRRKARSYWIGPSAIPRMNRTYDFRCPTCGVTFQLQCRSLLKRIDRCGVGCLSCGSIR